MAIRKAHMRTNRFGTKFSVREHHVENGPSSCAEEHNLKWKSGCAFINGSVTYQMTCPVCRTAVFFYRNSQGSRVFFDELGKPWPKHDCVHGIRRMQTIPVTSARQVTRKLLQTDDQGDAIKSGLYIDMDKVKTSVDSFNRDIRRSAKKARKAKKR